MNQPVIEAHHGTFDAPQSSPQARGQLLTAAIKRQFHLFSIHSDALQLDRVGLKGIPLANNQISVLQYANIVTVIKDALSLHQWL